MVRKKTRERLQLTEEIKESAKILKKGGIVVFPTDTVYGMGCKFDDKKAVGQIRKIKGTPKSQKMPVLIDNKKYLEKLGCKVTPKARNLIKKFWPGALTLIFNSDYGRIGLRMPNHPATLALIKEAGFPIIGTSANFHGRPAPTSFEELDKKFLAKVDFVLKGECILKKESTVIDVTAIHPRVLRLGAIKLDLNYEQ